MTQTQKRCCWKRLALQKLRYLLGTQLTRDRKKCYLVCPSRTQRRLEKVLPRRDLDKIILLDSSLKLEADETLFLELARRCYDPSKLRDEETTTGIIKIG